MTKPIFVLGKHRSGTTWIANQLCQHSLVAGITHEVHSGIHESAYFSLIDGRYGDLRRKSNFVEFVEVIVSSDYFRLAGASKERLFAQWPATYGEIFRGVMDRYAIQNGADYWLEKSPPHSVLVDKLFSIFPDAKFIAISRDVEAVVASTVSHPSFGNEHWQSRRRLIASTVFGWVLYNRILRAFSADEGRIIYLDYDELKSSQSKCLQKVCAFLEVGFEPQMCKQKFVPNTSFRNAAREYALRTSEKHLMWSMVKIFQHVPLRILALTYRLNKSRKRRPLPSWFFSLHPFNEYTDEVETLS